MFASADFDDGDVIPIAMVFRVINDVLVGTDSRDGPMPRGKNKTEEGTLRKLCYDLTGAMPAPPTKKHPTIGSLLYTILDHQCRVYKNITNSRTDLLVPLRSTRNHQSTPQRPPTHDMECQAVVLGATVGSQTEDTALSRTKSDARQFSGRAVTRSDAKPVVRTPVTRGRSDPSQRRTYEEESKASSAGSDTSVTKNLDSEMAAVEVTHLRTHVCGV